MAKNPRIQSLKSEIASIRKSIETRKKSIQSIKGDKTKIVERFKGQIARADKSDKAKLRDRKKGEIENLNKQIEALKRVIEDFRKRIDRNQEEIRRCK